MSLQKCRGWLDYGKKKKCPSFDLTNCSTPQIPPNCPVKELTFKRPCYRYKCSHSSEDNVSHSSEEDVPHFNLTTEEWHVSQHCFVASFINDVGLKFPIFPTCPFPLFR